jgi:hypothetical protein
LKSLRQNGDGRFARLDLQPVLHWEISIFSLFLGIVLTKGNTSTTTEIAAVVCFGLVSVFLLGWWLYLKWKQSEKGVPVPHSVLQEFDK